MASFDDVVIISGCRTPVGKFQGAFSDLSATQLGAVAVGEAVKRAAIDPALVDECVMGNVVSAGLGQNPARQAALNGGLLPEVSALTTTQIAALPNAIINLLTSGNLSALSVTQASVTTVTR